MLTSSSNARQEEEKEGEAEQHSHFFHFCHALLRRSSVGFSEEPTEALNLDRLASRTLLPWLYMYILPEWICKGTSELIKFSKRLQKNRCKSRYMLWSSCAKQRGGLVGVIKD